jgi:hypothetical protein
MQIGYVTDDVFLIMCCQNPVSFISRRMHFATADLKDTIIAPKEPGETPRGGSRRGKAYVTSLITRVVFLFAGVQGRQGVPSRLPEQQ